MGLFDSITSEVSEKFDLGDRAPGLVTVLISMITDSEQGGFNGFLDRFKEAGLGDLAASWVNTGANMPLSYEQTETVFGEGTLTEVSEVTDLDYKTATEATAFMVPHFVDKLTPAGEVPDEKGLLSLVSGYLTGIGDSISGASAGAAETAVVGNTDENFDGSGNAVLKIILPVIIIVLLVAAGYMLCGQSL